MTETMAKQIIATHKGGAGNKQQILCKFVNDNNLVKGNCVKVSTDL